MNDSILTSIKKLLGIEENYEHFDTDIIIHINSVFNILNQLGLRDDFFSISGKEEKWSDYYPDNKVINLVKTYIYLKVRKIFDPPQSSIHMDSIDKLISESEWRINIFIDENNNSDSNAYSRLDKLQDYFFYTEYDTIDYDYANKYFKTEPNFGMCSAIRKDNLFGKSHDWKYDELAEFVVRTFNSGGRYATLGMASSIRELTNDFVSSKKYHEHYKAVPLCIVDGINETGLSISINVVSQDKGDNHNVVASIAEKNRIHVVMIPRFILDNFDDAKIAAEYIRDYVTVYIPQSSTFDVHYMISDNNKTYVVEFEYGETKIFEIEKAYMTNFHLNGVTFNNDGSVYTPETKDETHSATITNNITLHGSGLERYNLINENYSNISDVEGMIELIKNLHYTKMYNTAPVVSNPYWYTELVNDVLTVDSDINDYSTIVTKAGQEYLNRKRDGITWESTHSSVYDLNNLSLSVFPQETNNRYDFKIES